MDFFKEESEDTGITQPCRIKSEEAERKRAMVDEYLDTLLIDGQDLAEEFEAQQPKKIKKRRSQATAVFWRERDEKGNIVAQFKRKTKNPNPRPTTSCGKEDDFPCQEMLHESERVPGHELMEVKEESQDLNEEEEKHQSQKPDDEQLHKWQQVGMYPLFLLGRKRGSKTVAECLCPITFNHPQCKEAQHTIRQIFVGLINAAQSPAQSPVTQLPTAQSPVTQLPTAQPSFTQYSAQPSFTQYSAQPPVAQSLAHPPVAQSSANPPVAQSSVKPPVALSSVKPSVAPSSVKPPVAPSSVKPPVAPSFVKPPVAQSSVKPPVAQSSVKPPVAQFLTQPQATQSSVQTLLAQSPTQPPVTQASLHPAISKTSVQPPVTLSLAQPSFARASAQPPIARASAQPQVTQSSPQPPITKSSAQSSAQPRVTQSFAKPSVTQSLAQPLVAQSTIQPPVTQSLCSTLPTLTLSKDLMEVTEENQELNEEEKRQCQKPNDEQKMESIKVSMKNCINCNMSFGVATKVCKACGVAQPMKQKLQNKMKKYDATWACTQRENGSTNKLFDETNLLLHKWQLLGMYPLFLLGRKRGSKMVAECLCPITNDLPQCKEALIIMRRIFVGLINATQLRTAQPPAFQPHVAPSLCSKLPTLTISKDAQQEESEKCVSYKDCTVHPTMDVFPYEEILEKRIRQDGECEVLIRWAPCPGCGLKWNDSWELEDNL
ncbi:bromodomain-containing protein 4A-like isoform X3 [Myxocyprinus asiaticus]|uniref:bromodomain-containing protein 4A-like isoform X3 n=1 Tax=Myxocyprinus asiaticus TaxID=70543 RepID=UPI0022220016|nr:bromodomain-containing protein 4A-like isoform X3 [Myxocyprinus asiaticus]